MKVILILIGIFISILGYSQNVSFTKDFELFSIRIDKKGVFFIPKEAELKRCLGKEEINFQNKVYLHEHPRFVEYGINVDQKFIQNDSIMRDMFYSYNMDNASIIEIKNNKLMVSINVHFFEARIKLDDKGNICKDPNGEDLVEDFNRDEMAFFLYDLKNRKTLVNDTLGRIEDMTAGGYFLKNSSRIGCSDCKYSLIDLEGNQVFPWVEVNEILNNREFLFKLHPEAQDFYGIKSSEETEYNQYCYIDKKGKSHLHTFNNFLRFAFKESTDFYFPDLFHSKVQNDKIYYVELEQGFEKYLLLPESNEWYNFIGDSVGTDPEKDFIIVDTTKSLMMIFSDYIIYSGKSSFETGNLENQDGSDSLDESGSSVMGIISEEKGQLVVFNKRTKKLIHDFNDRFLIDFNHNYYLAGKRNLILKDQLVTMHYEYFIYDKDFKEIKSTKDRKDFYKMK